MGRDVLHLVALGAHHLERRIVYRLLYELPDSLHRLARQDAGVDSQPCRLGQDVVLLTPLRLSQSVGRRDHGVHQRRRGDSLEQQAFQNIHVGCEEPQREALHVGHYPDEQFPYRRYHFQRFLSLLQFHRRGSQSAEPCVLRRSRGVSSLVRGNYPVIRKSLLHNAYRRKLLPDPEGLSSDDGTAFIQDQIQSDAAVFERSCYQVSSGQCRYTSDLLVLPEAEVYVLSRSISFLNKPLAGIHHHREMVLHVAGAASPDHFAVIFT